MKLFRKHTFLWSVTRKDISLLKNDKIVSTRSWLFLVNSFVIFLLFQTLFIQIFILNLNESKCYSFSITSFIFNIILALNNCVTCYLIAILQFAVPQLSLTYQMRIYKRFFTMIILYGNVLMKTPENFEPIHSQCRYTFVTNKRLTLRRFIFTIFSSSLQRYIC